MLRGRFGDTTGRPYFEGRLGFPRLGVFGDISFLMDTGADCSVLMPMDAKRLGVDYGKLTATAEACGVGGISKHFIEQAVVAFTDPGICLHIYNVVFRIASPSPDIDATPSLLMRDIIDRWAVSYDKSDTGLTASIISSDIKIPVKKQGGK